MIFRFLRKNTTHFTLCTYNKHTGSSDHMMQSNTKFEKIESYLNITASNINLKYNLSDIRKALSDTPYNLDGIISHKWANSGVLMFTRNNQEVITDFHLFKKQFEKLSR